MKVFTTVIALLLISGCQTNTSAELNACAQQNFQCEAQCERVAPKDTLSAQVCSGECTDEFNSCKSQAEQLTKRTN
ncbi:MULTISPECIES: hypothetical protein [Pseudoalteromonas]|uniref:Orphan protein n=1 Tax=Pseudoalteromonas amylolytica TaxID=1859457 RepID=A0A1S1MUS7_9GAMM|nr:MULTISPECIES: hypothetical protein [Pseudoalteromonas]MCF6435294.1 hypothetical protein [Pseudoalteromonas sp. MMG022]OHU88606.1 hypothetical protein BFC16_07940 [Pseudoalteromonas sp. JW3]OHU90449.1 hypothetical protein BET10_13775 [Pseudoalteromonas amylolytica]